MTDGRKEEDQVTHCMLSRVVYQYQYSELCIILMKLPVRTGLRKHECYRQNTEIVLHYVLIAPIRVMRVVVYL